ncbi:MAG: hypothetical protein Q9163_001953 [Psora crenata]
MAYFSVFSKARSVIRPPTKNGTNASSQNSADAKSIARTRQRSMSPPETNRGWLHSLTRKTERRASDHDRVKTGRVTKNNSWEKRRNSFWNVPAISTFFAQSSGHQAEKDFDGDTVVIKEEQSESASEDNENTLVNEDTVNDEINERTDINDRFLDYNDPRVKEWSVEEVWMFNKLSMRGFEPLLSEEWQWDFPSFPDPLFTKDESLVFINNLNTSITDGKILTQPHPRFRLISILTIPDTATNELNALVQAGPRCRDAILLKQQPEQPLKKGIERYKKWSLRDGKLLRKPHIDMISVATAKPGETVQSVVHRITDKLYSLGREWRNKWRHPDHKESDVDQGYMHEPPTLYGFVIKYSVVAIVTCDARMPTKPVRTLVTLDFQQLGQDVWHALAISIVCVRTRNYLLQLEEEGQIGEEILDDSDPDA